MNGCGRHGLTIVCGQPCVCVHTYVRVCLVGGLNTDYLLPEVGRVEPCWGNLQAGSISGAFLKGG